jgi:hypothetical protein
MEFNFAKTTSSIRLGTWAGIEVLPLTLTGEQKCFYGILQGQGMIFHI